MIAEATHQSIQIDFGPDEPGMTLQREYRKGGYLIWRDYLVNGEPVIAPVGIDALPSGRYRLVSWLGNRAP